MPIEMSVPVKAISQEEFHAIDRVMLGHAFEIHNELGRLFDEEIYKAELAERCSRHGFQVQREVRIRVRHRAFVKDYFVDLLLCGSTIVEAKTVQTLTEAHHGQGLNYVLLAGTQHGSLVNFRQARVVRRFLSTTLTPSTRAQFAVTTSEWPRDVAYAHLHDVVCNLCHDIGLGLDLPLYREAICALTGSRRELVPVMSSRGTIGNQEMSLLLPDVGLAVTALRKLQDHRTHLHRLLAITPLSHIAWVNLQLGSITFERLSKARRRTVGGGACW